MKIFDCWPGSSPLVVSVPHDGRQIPADIAARLTPEALALPDTDWHVAQLYAFVRELGATLIVARPSRYVVDLNRPPDGGSLYPGRWGTGLVPTHTFAGEPLYADHVPDEEEVQARTRAYWRPYHEALAAELTRVKDQHGHALLWDAHSIRSEVPSLFSGRLPDLNLGSADGASCEAGIADAVARAAAESPHAYVRDGRFKGGYITRAYGAPDQNVHALQLELVQATYMDEDPPYRYVEERARVLQPTLRSLLRTFVDASQPA